MCSCWPFTNCAKAYIVGTWADWSVQSFWEHQRTALFDICILNADDNSLCFQSLQSKFQARNHHKKQKYSDVAEVRRASFTPIITTAEAIFDKEAEIYMKRLATISILSRKWNSSCSQAL